MGEIIILLFPPVAILLMVWGMVVCCRSKVVVGDVEIRGNFARVIGLFTSACGLLILPAFCVFVSGPHALGVGQINTAFANHWPAIFGVLFAGLGASLTIAGFQLHRWQAIAFGLVLLGIGTLLMLQLGVLERLLFQLAGRH